jgi:hypothetical protein
MNAHRDSPGFAGGFQFKFGTGNTSNGGTILSPPGDKFTGNPPRTCVNRLTATALARIPSFIARAFTNVDRFNVNGPR